MCCLALPTSLYAFLPFSIYTHINKKKLFHAMTFLAPSMFARFPQQTGTITSPGLVCEEWLWSSLGEEDEIRIVG